jgi:fatty acid desaturase
MSASATGRVLWHTPNFLSSEVIRALSEVSVVATVGMIVVDIAVIVIVAALSEWTHHPIAYFLAVIAIAGRLHNLGALGAHEGAHYRLAKNKVINDLIANYVLTPLVFFDMPTYRKTHLVHHQYVGQDGDTEKGIELPNEPAKGTAALLALGCVFAPIGLVGLGFVLALVRQRPIRGLIMMAGSIALVWSAVNGNFPCLILVKYWLIPFASWLGVLVYVRSILEHLRVPATHSLFNENRVFLTRTVHPSWFDRIFVIPVGLNYHLEHHLYPSVPCYRLGRLHRLLMANEEYRRQALINRGYFRAVCGLVAEIWRGPVPPPSIQPATTE